MQKVLIITYYWPPAGGPGVQRWLNFVKYLPEFGIEPIVFVPENASYPIKDKSLVDATPNNIQVISQPIFEPYGIASIFTPKKTKRISAGIIKKRQKQSLVERMLLWIRGNLFIPDARKNWVRPSIQRISQLIHNEQITNIITTGPPHSVHLIGLGLKEEHQITWTADFRDPWTSIGYHKKLKLTEASKRKHKALEQKVLNTADTIVVTSQTTKDEFATITKRPIEVVTNGFEAAALDIELDTKFTLSHIGTLLTDRNPIGLWEALKELVEEHKAFANQLNIRLIGIVGDGVKDSLDDYGLSPFISYEGYVTHDVVRNYQARSQVLLLLEIDSEETKGIIPGKLFEYFNAKRPILALGPENWEAGQMVEAHQAGVYYKAQNKGAVKKVLLDWFTLFQNGDLQCKSVGIEQYHRRNLTKKLAKLL